MSIIYSCVALSKTAPLAVINSSIGLSKALAILVKLSLDDLKTPSFMKVKSFIKPSALVSRSFSIAYKSKSFVSSIVNPANTAYL